MKGSVGFVKSQVRALPENSQLVTFFAIQGYIASEASESHFHSCYMQYDFDFV